jgi:hypothetical protein
MRLAKATTAPTPTAFIRRQPMNPKTILGAATLALALGLATTALPAAAQDKMATMAKSADADKDGMVSKAEFLAQAARMYDERIAALKKMPAAQQAKTVKDNKMTFDAYVAFWTLMGQ